jgi:hypothetical protein
MRMTSGNMIVMRDVISITRERILTAMVLEITGVRNLHSRVTTPQQMTASPTINAVIP